MSVVRRRGVPGGWPHEFCHGFSAATVLPALPGRGLGPGTDGAAAMAAGLFPAQGLFPGRLGLGVLGRGRRHLATARESACLITGPRCYSRAPLQR